MWTNLIKVGNKYKLRNGLEVTCVQEHDQYYVLETNDGFGYVITLEGKDWFSSGDGDIVAHIPDIPLLDDVEWEYLSELTKERDRVRELSNRVTPKCTTGHEWVNISLMSIREVCKHCDVERKEGDK